MGLVIKLFGEVFDRAATGLVEHAGETARTGVGIAATSAPPRIAPTTMFSRHRLDTRAMNLALMNRLSAAAPSLLSSTVPALCDAWRELSRGMPGADGRVREIALLSNPTMFSKSGEVGRGRTVSRVLCPSRDGDHLSGMPVARHL